MTKGKKVKNRKPLVKPSLESSRPMGEVFIHPELGKCVTYAMYKLAMRMRFSLDAAFAEYHLMTPLYGIMRLLHLEGSMSQVHIGQYTNMDKATIVKMIDHLEARKFVRRVNDKKDRRVKLIELTAQGSATLQKAFVKRQEVENELLQPLSSSEKEELVRLLRKIIVGISKV